MLQAGGVSAAIGRQSDGRHGGAHHGGEYEQGLHHRDSKALLYGQETGGTRKGSACRAGSGVLGTFSTASCCLLHFMLSPKLTSPHLSSRGG